MKLIQELSEGWRERLKQHVQDFLPVREKDIVPGAKFAYRYEDGAEHEFYIVRVIGDRASLGIPKADGEILEIINKPMDLSDLYDGDDEEIKSMLRPFDNSYEHMMPKKQIVSLLRSRNARRIL